MQIVNELNPLIRKIFKYLITLIIVAIGSHSGYSQNNANSENQITSSDLESYVTFLASPLLKGRKNGEEGLEIASRYIVSQATVTRSQTS